MPKVMKPITKCISYGYSKSVQLFSEEGKEKYSVVYVLVISERDINGELQNIAEYRYYDYIKAVQHLHNLMLNFIYLDLYQQ